MAKRLLECAEFLKDHPLSSEGAQVQSRQRSPRNHNHNSNSQDSQVADHSEEQKQHAQLEHGHDQETSAVTLDTPLFHIDVALQDAEWYDEQQFRRKLHAGGDYLDKITAALKEQLGLGGDTNANVYTTVRPVSEPYKPITLASLVNKSDAQVYKWIRGQFDGVCDRIFTLMNQINGSAMIALHDTEATVKGKSRICKTVFFGGFGDLPEPKQDEIKEILHDTVHDIIEGRKEERMRKLQKVALVDDLEKAFDELKAQKGELEQAEYDRRGAAIYRQRMLALKQQRRQNANNADDGDNDVDMQ